MHEAALHAQESAVRRPDGRFQITGPTVDGPLSSLQPYTLPDPAGHYEAEPFYLQHVATRIVWTRTNGFGRHGHRRLRRSHEQFGERLRLSEHGFMRRSEVNQGSGGLRPGRIQVGHDRFRR